MQQLTFTTHILGPLASLRLEKEEITQTLRSRNSDISVAFDHGGLKVGDAMRVVLDNRMIGLAELSIIDQVTWADLDIGDARRGGFDSLADLELALQRAGYRFRPIDMYRLYRVQFTWLLR